MKNPNFFSSLAIFVLFVASCTNSLSNVTDLATNDATVTADASAGADGASDGGKAGYAQACINDGDCESNLCASYDKKPTKLCSYECKDQQNPNPLCPDGCNNKGVCRIP